MRFIFSFHVTKNLVFVAPGLVWQLPVSSENQTLLLSSFVIPYMYDPHPETYIIVIETPTIASAFIEEKKMKWGRT
jgi:hypothetical protein